MNDQHDLKPGTILNHYKIIRVLGAGGFGITYLAKDIQLGMEVVIKEYFPNEFAIRNNDSTIIAKTASDRDFNKGKQRFKEEAQVLAKFNHPSIVKILGYFEANNTAYFVMEYEEGLDLSQYIKQLNRPITQEEILSIIMPILEGLKEVHKYNYLHRDIKPGNILIRKNKAPVLIDFGATRVAVNDEQSKSVTSMLTEGYAPIEQYNTDLKQQGAFTDIYAIGAVMFKMITMGTPVASQTRSFDILQHGKDPLEKLSDIKFKEYDATFLKAIDKALEIKPNDREQSIDELQLLLMYKSEQIKEKNLKYSDEQGFEKTLFEKNQIQTSIKKINLIMFISVFIVFLLSSYFFITSYLNFEKANALKTTLINNAALDKAFINIGKESGLTALYLGSDKKAFAEPLKKQREALDEAFEDAKYEIITENTAYLPVILELLGEQKAAAFDPYKQLLGNIGKLSESRNKIDTEDVDFKDVFFNDYASKLATPVLDKLITVKQYSLDTEMSSIISTLIQLYTAKQNAGMERGFISYYMAKRSSMAFDEIALWDEFKTKANSFDIKQVTNPILREELEVVLYNDQAKETMNELGLTSSAIQTDIDNGDYAEDVMDWFALQTQKIALLSKAELVVSDALWKMSDIYLEQQLLLLSIAIFVWIMSLILAFSGYITRKNILKKIE